MRTGKRITRGQLATRQEQVSDSATIKSTSRNRSAIYPAKGTSKQRGELAEMMFMVKAANEGFGAAKPYGDSNRYDFIVDAEKRLWRVQVKSSCSQQYGAYAVNAQRHANGRTIAYSASEIDFVVALVLPEDAWFVIPVEALGGRKNLRLCLRGDPRHGEFGKYWEAWGLMRG
jgi:hypothetical protein